MHRAQLLIVRHGETLWNVERRCQGHADIPLNERGIEQAEKLAFHLQNSAIDAIYASDLSRAVQTAEKVGERHGLPVWPLRELRERFYGELEGLTREQMAERYPIEEEAWLNVWRKGGKYGVELFTDFERRIVKKLTNLAREHIGGRILVVSHGGSINAFLHGVTAGELGTGVTRIDNTGVTTAEFSRDGGWKVIRVNDTKHLEGVELK